MYSTDDGEISIAEKVVGNSKYVILEKPQSDGSFKLIGKESKIEEFQNLISEEIGKIRDTADEIKLEFLAENIAQEIAMRVKKINAKFS